MLTLSTSLRRRRRHLAVVLAVVGLAAAVVGAHSALQGDHMAMGAAMCLAIAETGVGMALLTLRRQPGDLRPWPVATFTLAPAAPVRAPLGRARAGPAVLQVFRR